MIGPAALRRSRLCPEVAVAGAGSVEEARRAHGRTHISSFATTADKTAVRLGSGAVVGFRVSLGVAVVPGDPLAEPAMQPQAIAEFVDLCRARGRSACFYQTLPELRGAYHGAGMRLVKFGEEALVDLEDFTLAVPGRANLRREVGRARRGGLDVTVLRGTEAAGALTLREELEELSRAWLREHGGREMGFSLGRLADLVERGDAWLGLVRGPAGEIQAFSSWLPLGGDGIALDLVRRRPGAAAGAMDLCLAAALEAARSEGLRVASLGSVPCRDAAGDAPDGPLARRLRATLYARGAGSYDYRSLARFKDKFAPRWESRDIALPRSPAAALAAAALVRVHLGGGPRRPS